MTTKRFLVIGFSKKTHIKSVAQQGHKLVLFVTKEKHKKYQSEIKDVAASFEKIVVFDNIYQWSNLKKELDRLPPIDAVITRYDHHVNVLGAINQYLGLQGLDYVATKKFSNKYLMKLSFQKKQVPCADGICLDRFDSLDSFLTEKSFPLIVKTTTGTHSRFVFKVNSKEELIRKRSQIINQVGGELSSKSVQGYDEFKNECQVLVEECLTGKEISVDTFVSGDKFLHTPITQYTMADELNIDDSYLPIRTMPSRFSQELENRIFKIVEQALNSLSAKNCVCHTELFVDEETQEINLVETTPRGGGNRAEMTKLLTGFDYDLSVFKAAAGILTPQILNPEGAVSVVEYFAPEDGIIEQMDLSFLKKNQRVFDVRSHYELGAEVKKAENGGQNIVLFFVKAENHQDSKTLAIELLDEVKSSIKVRKDS